MLLLFCSSTIPSVCKDYYKQQYNNNTKYCNKNTFMNSLVSSKSIEKQFVLRFDINSLLSLFNEMEITGSGQITKKQTKIIFDTIGLVNYQQHLKSQSYSFDHILSLIGLIEVPSEPSIYVLSFVKILAEYRGKCILKDESGLIEAKQVQDKIKGITMRELERQKERLKKQHNKIYEQMQISQEKQYHSFQAEWGHYLDEFKQQTKRKLQQTKFQRRQIIVREQNKMIETARRSSVIASPRLRQLVQKKKLYVKDRRYSNAIKINQMIQAEKDKIIDSKEQNLHFLVRKKLSSLQKKNQRTMDYVETSLRANLEKLLQKKKEGQNIMKIRMKNLREEAQRKLNDHYRNQMSRLRSSFYLASNN